MVSTTATTQDHVTGNWLQAHLDDPDVRVVEVDVSAAAYGEGHIPGAALWDIYSDLKGDRCRPVDDASFEALVRSSGIEPTTTVVFYGYAPAFGYWLLRHHGHESVRLLNVDRDTWRSQGLPWTAVPTSVAPSSYELPVSASVQRARRADVQRASRHEDQILLDVRTDLEFAGERFWPSGGIPEGAAAGHVPSAVHLPATELLDEDGVLLPADELRAAVEAIGLSADQPIITYCTVGARAALVWFALTRVLAFTDVRVYDGSWVEWAMDGSNPVAP